MTTIDQDGQLDGAGSTEVGEGVEGGPDGPSREEDVVDQHHGTTVEVDGDVSAGERRGGPGGEVVAVEADVEEADRGAGTGDLVEVFGEAAGEGDTAGLDPYEDDTGVIPGAFDYLVGNPTQGAVDVVGAEDAGAFHGVAAPTPGSMSRIVSLLPGLTGPDLKAYPKR